MPKPLRRIGASKLAAVSECHTSQTDAAQVLPLFPSLANRQPLPTHVLERPEAGIVLTIASGSRAGEMIGIEDQEIMIGFSHDCLLRFRNDQYPLARGKLLLRRGTEGWYALRVSGNSAFINQHQLKDKCPLRSGDILRLSSRGPDVQFTMQSGGLAIRELVERFLPSQAGASSQPVAQAAEAEQRAAALPRAQPADAAVDVAAVDVAAVDITAVDITAVDITTVEAAAVEAAAVEPVAASQAAGPRAVLWSKWAWSRRSVKRAIALLVVMLVLMVVLAFASSSR